MFIYKMQNIDTLVNLIKAIKNHPTLFTNLEQNDECKEWIEVAQECEMTITQAQDQWNQLLIGYIEYLKNNQEFSLAQHMDFLQPYFFTINDGENIDEDELLKAIDFKRIEEHTTKFAPTKNEEIDYKISDLENKIKIEQTGKSNMASTTVIENRKSEAPNDSSAMPRDSSFTNLSSLELIFLGYAKQLQKMPLSIQLKTKRKIADIMDEAELQMINSS